MFFRKPVFATMAQAASTRRVAQEEFMAACRAALLCLGLVECRQEVLRDEVDGVNEGRREGHFYGGGRVKL